MTAIVIHGAGGRMGQAVAEAASGSDEISVVAGVLASGRADALPQWPDAEIARSLEEVSVAFDVVVDFSSPAGAAAAAGVSAGRGSALVTGTTGLDDGQNAALRKASEQVPVVAAPNFSVGITLLVDLVARATRAMGPGADAEVLESHHRYKADAPSGTALRLGEAVARARGASLRDLACFDRRAEQGPRGDGSIGFSCVRAGDIVGEHQVLLALEGERIELGHRATDRGIFARGALRAATWAAGRAPGYYDMRDVLDL